MKMGDEEKALRALFAGLAMQALVGKAKSQDSRTIALRAVEIAEELFAELEASFEGETTEFD
jgi:hypothetical protein